MEISDLDYHKKPGTIRVDAAVTWEDCDRPATTCYAETLDRFQDAFWPDPNGFLVGSIFAAWHYEERRVKVHGPLCPVLCQGIKAAFMTVSTWAPELGPPPLIESTQGYKALHPFRAQSASFLSCGIDSLATLRSVNLHLPEDHPSFIRGAIHIDFSNDPFTEVEESLNRARKRAAAAEGVAADVGAMPVPVETNMLDLDMDGYFYSYRSHGAILSSIAYFLSHGFSKVYIGSTDDPTCLGPWGSHPLLDPNYSSAHLQIVHHGTHMTRLDKTAVVADWPVARSRILVCQAKNSRETNCGACEKCIRTMLALVVLGKLDECESFPLNDVTPELVKTIGDYKMLYSDYQAACYRELSTALRERGRDDIASVLDDVLVSYVPRQSGWIRKVEEDG